MKRFPTRAITVTLAAACAALTAACASGTGSTAASPAKGKVVTYHADYQAYDSPDRLFKKADLVVQATLSDTPLRVQELAPRTTGDDPKLNPAAGASATQSHSPDDNVVITVYAAKITRVYRGQAKVGQTIEVQQLGGTFKGVTYEEADPHPLSGGKRYVLFLETYPDAPAALLNPLQGQYPLDTAGAPGKLPGNPISLSDRQLKKLSGD